MKKYLLTVLLLIASLATAQVASLPSNADWKPVGAAMGYYPPNEKYYVLPINASGALIVDAGEVGGDTLIELNASDVVQTIDDKAFSALKFQVLGDDVLTASGTELTIGNSSNTITKLYGELYLKGNRFAKTSGTNWMLFSSQSIVGVTGAYNYFAGEYSGTGNTSGGYNLGLGYQTLFGNTTGSYNVSIGRDSLRSITGSSNIGIGYGAGAQMASGSYNTAMTDNLFLGENTRSLANATVKEIVIGNDAIGHGSMTVTIGDYTNTINYLYGTQNLSDVAEYADNAAAAAAGLASGTFYHTAGVLKIVY